jgi:hypothetical protein
VSGPLTNPGIDDPDLRAGIKLYSAPRALGSDCTTDADIAAGKPSSYYIAVKKPDGNWTPTMTKGNQVIASVLTCLRCQAVRQHRSRLHYRANPLTDNPAPWLNP